MTTTVPTNELPDHKGEKVTHAAIKFTGVGTGFEGLDVRPVVMELDDQAYFVIRVTAAESASHKRNQRGELVRLQRVKAEDMAPISRDLAQKVLQEYAAAIEKAKAELDGQTSIEDELAAQEREARDETDSPSEIAASAAKRAKTRGR